MERLNYDMEQTPVDLFSRNWAFISPELQHTLDHTCIFAAGVGLSSTIAVLACRTGFGAFILADGDQVENSNLNRQAFFRRQIGENKAVATAELLRDIRPDVTVTVLPEYIEGHSYRAALDQSQIVINSMDYDNPAIFALARDARERGIPMIVPLNLGWGGAVTIFTADSMPLEEFLGLTRTDSLNAADVLGRLLTGAFAGSPGGVPPYLGDVLADFQVHGAEWPCEPQLGPAASLTAAMVVRAATALAAHEPVRVAPEVFHVDLRALLEPTSQIARSEQPLAQATERPTATDALTAPMPVPAPAPTSTSTATQTSGTQTPGENTVQRMPTRKRGDDDFRKYLRSRQMQARYRALTAIATKGKNLIYLRHRPSGLWIYAIRHDQLDADALHEFGEFRLDQYSLAGFYETAKIAEHGYRTDPTLTSAPDATIHLLCGTKTGQVLACCSIIPAKGTFYSEPEGRLLKRRRPLVLSDETRALFPSETELFGRGVFESLPAIQQIPVERIREVGHLMRNQAIKSPLAGISVFEIVYAVTQVLPNPQMGIDMSLGNMGPEARNLVALADIPVLYAPWAQVVVAETNPEEDFWAPPTNAEGFFWPFVLASADLAAISPYLRRLDQALASEGDTTRNALITLAREADTAGLPQAPFVTQAQIPGRWFVAPPYGPRIQIAQKP